MVTVCPICVQFHGAINQAKGRLEWFMVHNDSDGILKTTRQLVDYSDMWDLHRAREHSAT
ncbi:hypothetical protein GCM10020000_85170 [Streptomyces olivoverticillatus]